MDDMDATMQEDDAYEVDWVRLRAIRDRRLAAGAKPSERAFGVPEREGVVRREADRMHHSQARRGAEYVDWSKR